MLGRRLESKFNQIRKQHQAAQVQMEAELLTLQWPRLAFKFQIKNALHTNENRLNLDLSEN